MTEQNKQSDTPAPAQQKRVRHKQRGSEYDVVGVGKMQSEHWWERNPNRGQATFGECDQLIDMREVTIYRSTNDGSLWVRPSEEFEDGRFEEIGTAAKGRSSKTEDLEEAIRWCLDRDQRNGSLPEAYAERLRASLSNTPSPQSNLRGLTLASLQRSHVERQEEWCPDQKPDLSFRGNELGGECGEAQNVIKKLERERLGWRGSRDTVEHLAEGLADVIHCAVLCAITAGIDLEPAVVAKFNSTSEKNGLATLITTAPMSETTPVSETDGAAISDRADNPRRYMCGENELARADGYGDTECELMDARWISSAECWDQAASEPPVDKSNSGSNL